MNNNGLEITDLGEIPILRRLKDEERSIVKSVHVYGSSRSEGEGPSALYVTTKDEVFLAGFDCLIRKKGVDGLAGILQKSVKVKELSGKSVKRIVVGDEFGAALTSGGDLYLWGTDVGPVGVELPAGLSRMALESHYDGATCSMCYELLRPDSYYDPSMSRCGKHQRSWQNRVFSLPPPTSWTGRPLTVLGFSTTATNPPVFLLFCLKCGGFRRTMFYTISNFKIAGCSSCFNLFDGDQLLIPTQKNPAPQKVTFTTDLPIVDIAAGKAFLLVQTSSKLIIWGHLGGKKHNRAISIQDTVSFTKVACGSAHIAVITDQGDLYTCGVGDAGQLGYTWAATDGCMTLKKVTLKAPAVDVACGLTSTVCLLQNGAHIFYGNVTKVVTGLSYSLNLFDSVLLCVPTVVFQNYSKVMESAMKKIVTQSVQKPTILTGDPTDVFIHLHGASVTSPDGAKVKPGFCGSEESKPTDKIPEDQDNGIQNEPELEEKLAGAESESTSHPQQSSHLAHLFGQHLLSDLTLKLADGDFPVHRLALYTSSAYFRQTFSDSNASAVLDMSSYNPSAYRSLLQYFYGVPLTQMTCEDTFDLYVLATSYKEEWIAADVLSKLKADINPDNVLLLHDKAEAANATELVQECQAFIDTPEVKQPLLDLISQNKKLLMEAFRLYKSIHE